MLWIGSISSFGGRIDDVYVLYICNCDCQRRNYKSFDVERKKNTQNNFWNIWINICQWCFMAFAEMFVIPKILVTQNEFKHSHSHSYPIPHKETKKCPRPIEWLWLRWAEETESEWERENVFVFVRKRKGMQSTWGANLDFR